MLEPANDNDYWVIGHDLDWRDPDNSDVSANVTAIIVVVPEQDYNVWIGVHVSSSVYDVAVQLRDRIADHIKEGQMID